MQIAVRVQPGSRTEGITWTADDTILVKSTAPPRDGEANDDVVLQLAAALGCGKSALAVVSGHKSRGKVVAAQMGADAVLARLEAFKAAR